MREAGSVSSRVARGGGTEKTLLEQRRAGGPASFGYSGRGPPRRGDTYRGTGLRGPGVAEAERGAQGGEWWGGWPLSGPGGNGGHPCRASGVALRVLASIVMR